MLVEGDVEIVIAELKPKIVVKGWEFRLQTNREADVVASYGGELRFSPDRFSSSFYGHPKSSMMLVLQPSLIQKSIWLDVT